MKFDLCIHQSYGQQFHIQTCPDTLSGHNVDKERGLNGFCDFLLSRSIAPYLVEAPVLMLVEAKKRELDVGLGQCIAEMLAALQSK